MPFNDYTGVVHLHSAYSFDGRTPIAEIVAAAQKEGLDFLLLTDHSTMQARNDGYEGWHGGTLLVVGEEIAPRFNHLLAFGMDSPVGCAESEPDLPPQEYIDRVRARGGVGFIAHPDHKGAPLFHVKHYPWNDWSVTGYAGIGIWDFMTDWQNSLTGHLRAVLSFAFPAYFLRGPASETLERWDRLTQTRPIAGIGELDNHNSRKRVFGMPFSVFPFSRTFRLIRTHILTEIPVSGQSRSDIPLLLESLQRGRAYVSLDHFRPANGFSLTLMDDGQTATMGDEFLLRRSAKLRAAFPHRARIRLIRNGKLFQEAEGEALSATLRASGVYRVEADLKSFGRYRPWIFSNPIYVKDRRAAATNR
jgi:hypothetical protein